MLIVDSLCKYLNLLDVYFTVSDETVSSLVLLSTNSFSFYVPEYILQYMNIAT